MTIEALNSLPLKQAEDWFARTCTAKRWCSMMVAHRPYTSIEQLKAEAEKHWLEMTNDDLLEAFSGHPMIGNVESLKAKYANTKAIAADEQRGMAEADEATYKRLHDLNHEYLKRHGFIFIVCATGLSAPQMLRAIEDRIENTTQQEYIIAAEEQLKITLLRFDKALREQNE